MPSSAINSSPSAAARRQSPSAGGRNAENLIIYCCVCLLPVASGETGNADRKDPQFWLTSCGHIVCGLHCFPAGVPSDAARTTHTCPYCSSSGISLADLAAGKASLELRDYFRPEAELLEDVAGAIKFRMSNAIRIASHYKALAEKLQGKVDDQRRVLLKVKDELVEGKELKKKKPIMEAEIIHLRQEVSQLRAQLSSAQLSSLDYDGPQPAQQQYQSETGTTRQKSSSPVTTTPENPNPNKRKADDIGGDPAFRAREFRDEMNKRQAMPPPPLPLPAQRIEQYPDNRREEQHSEHRQEQHQEQRIGYNNQSQQLGYSPQQQHSPVNHERQFVDLTESVVTSMRPPPLPYSRGKFINQQQQGGSQLLNGYAKNVNIPFQSPLRVSTPSPISSIPTRGVGDGYFTPLNHQSPRTETRYGNNMPPMIQGSGTKFLSPRDRTGHFLTRQGESVGYPYDRGGQSFPSTQRTSSKGGGSVVSPFFTNPPATLGSLGLQSPAIGGGVRRPASVTGFVGQQVNFNRSCGSGLGDGGFFSRHDDSLVSGGGLVGAMEVPDWGTPRSGKNMSSFPGGGETRPGTVQRFSRSGGENMFGLERGVGGGLGGVFRGGIGSAPGSGTMDRPGLRRSVRRD